MIKEVVPIKKNLILQSSQLNISMKCSKMYIEY